MRLTKENTLIDQESGALIIRHSDEMKTLIAMDRRLKMLEVQMSEALDLLRTNAKTGGERHG